MGTTPASGSLTRNHPWWGPRPGPACLGSWARFFLFQGLKSGMTQTFKSKKTALFKAQRREGHSQERQPDTGVRALKDPSHCLKGIVSRWVLILTHRLGRIIIFSYCEYPFPVLHLISHHIQLPKHKAINWVIDLRVRFKGTTCLTVHAP